MIDLTKYLEERIAEKKYTKVLEIRRETISKEASFALTTSKLRKEMRAFLGVLEANLSRFAQCRTEAARKEAEKFEGYASEAVGKYKNLLFKFEKEAAEEKNQKQTSSL